MSGMHNLRSLTSPLFPESEELEGSVVRLSSGAQRLSPALPAIVDDAGHYPSTTAGSPWRPFAPGFAGLKSGTMAAIMTNTAIS
jgi:hypothetical protein